jgi:tetratricopeptide (TPR) repeat protein
MRELRRSRPLISLIALIALAISPAFADEAETSDAEAHLLRAENALKTQDFLTAVREYGRAADASGSADTARDATRLAFAYRFNDESLHAAKRWAKLDPDSDEPRLYLAQIYFRLGDLRNSRRQYAALIKKGAEDPGTRLLSLVRYLSEEGDAEAADKLMRSLAKPYPDSAWAHYAAAALALEAGDAKYAMQRALRSSELEPDNVRPKLLYARAMMVDGDRDKAIDYTARIIGDDPDPDSDARMELAIMYMMDGRDDDALSQVNQVLLEDSGRADALRLMAIINFRQGYLDAAADDFEDLLATGQYRMDALYYLARIADINEDYDTAISLYREIRYGADALDAQRRASALLLFENDDEAGAMELLDEFALTSPANAVDVLLAKAQLLATLDRFEESLALYDRVTGYRPNDEGAALSRAELLLKMDRVDDALDAYGAAAKRWPKSALSLNAYGYTLADRTDRYREAEKLIRKAIEYEPDSPAIIDSLGWVLFKLGRYEEALVQLQRAYEGFDDPEVAAHIVEVLAALDRHDEAMALLEEAETRRPENELLKDVRERLFSAND